MSLEETRLAVALALFPLGAVLLAAVAGLWSRSRPRRGALMLLAVAGALGAVWRGQGARAGEIAFEAPLFTWSPLGLYGVTLGVRPNPAAALLTLPALLLAAAGLVAWRGSQRAGRSTTGSNRGTAACAWEDALALTAVSGALWSAVAADLVSLHLGASLFWLATTGLLWSVAGALQAGRRLLLVNVAATGSLTCVLILGKVNGHFQLSQLSTAGFTSAALVGLTLAAAVAAPLPPFHGWLLRLARYPLAPALGAAGAAVAFALLLVAFRLSGEQLAPGWQRLLIAAGGMTTVVGASAAFLRRAPALRLAALFGGRAGLLFQAAGVATPASMAAALLYFTLALPVLGVLWLLAMSPGSSRTAHHAPWGARLTPGFGVTVLLLASAAGLPGTVGNLSTEALVRALTSSPAGHPWLRLPPLLLDVATLAAGSRLLWRAQPLSTLHGPAGWLLLVVTVALLIGPVATPGWAIDSWLGPAAAVAAGTGLAPLILEVSPRPSLVMMLVAAIAAAALWQRLHGREWLPAPARTMLGAVALVAVAVRRRWRRAGLAAAPANAGSAAWRRLQRSSARLVAFLQPIEERYYAAAAVTVAVALIYIIGR